MARPQGLPERSTLGGVQRKRAEIVTLKLAAMSPRYHLLPACDHVWAPTWRLRPHPRRCGAPRVRAHGVF